jgi:secondary thiamine-phosphate synthase enzyme
MLDKITVTTRKRNQLVDITADVQHVIKKHGTESGTVHVYCPHTTAAITINENADPSVQSDITTTLSTLVPHRGDYTHGEGNADAHVKAAIVGSSRTLFIQNSRIAFGTWQGIYFCEFDGPRTREVWVKVVKE